MNRNLLIGSIIAMGIYVMTKQRLPPSKFDLYFESAEQRYHLPPNLLSAVAKSESGYNPDAISPVGALGLMQFMPATAKELEIDPLNPIEAIFGAGKYLAWLFNRVNTWPEALAAYNWGIGNVERKGISKAPTETVRYVAAVTRDSGISI